MHFILNMFFVLNDQNQFFKKKGKGFPLHRLKGLKRTFNPLNLCKGRPFPEQWAERGWRQGGLQCEHLWGRKPSSPMPRTDAVPTLKTISVFLNITKRSLRETKLETSFIKKKLKYNKNTLKTIYSGLAAGAHNTN